MNKLYQLQLDLKLNKTEQEQVLDLFQNHKVSVEGYAGAIGFYTRNAADASVLKTTDEKMRLDGNGLGIGTAASGGRLHVHYESPNTYLKVTNNSGTRAFLGCESGEAVIYAQDDSGGNAELAFHTGGTEQFKMTTTGIAFPSGKGISFSATNDAATMTSELFNDYEEGTYTPTDSSGAGLTLTNNTTARYTKIGRMMYVQFDITWPSNSNSNAGWFFLTSCFIGFLWIRCSWMDR